MEINLAASIFNHDKYDRSQIELSMDIAIQDYVNFFVEQNINVIIGIVGLFHELQDRNVKNM